jgi:heat shock protein HslJ
MTRFAFVPLLFVAVAAPAGAQNARSFPLDKSFKVISISGFDVQKAAITLTVSSGVASGRLKGAGHAGCNSWTAAFDIRDDQLDVSEVAITRKFCGKPRMTTEEAFLTTLKSAHRWRLDDKGRLILEGEAARLLLTSAGMEKPAEQKPDKKSGKTPLRR